MRQLPPLLREVLLYLAFAAGMSLTVVLLSRGKVLVAAVIIVWLVAIAIRLARVKKSRR